jgi:hypothetical protein
VCCCFRCFVVDFAAVSVVVEVICPTVATASLDGAATTEAEFLDEIQTKVLRVVLLAVHSHLYSFVLKLLFLQTHATSYNFFSSVTEQYM